MAYDDDFERHERQLDEEHREEQQLDRDIRHAPAPGRGPAPEPPAGWRRSGRGTIERIPTHG
jgi:hypothetical protein